MEPITQFRSQPKDRVEDLHRQMHSGTYQPDGIQEAAVVCLDIIASDGMAGQLQGFGDNPHTTPPVHRSKVGRMFILQDIVGQRYRNKYHCHSNNL